MIFAAAETHSTMGWHCVISEHQAMAIVAWKFEAEVHLPDGRVFPRVSYVKLSDKHAAARALHNEYPMARFAIDRGQPLTKEALETALAGDCFLPGEVVRCLYSPLTA